jgi:hypothetical protein
MDECTECDWDSLVERNEGRRARVGGGREGLSTEASVCCASLRVFALTARLLRVVRFLEYLLCSWDHSHPLHCFALLFPHPGRTSTR